MNYLTTVVFQTKQMKKNQLRIATVLQRAVAKKKEIRIEMPSQKEEVVDNDKKSDYYMCTDLIVEIHAAKTKY